MSTIDLTDRWLSKPDVALILSTTTRTVDRWVARGVLPPPDRLPNGRPAWRASVVYAAVRSAESAA